MADYCGTLAAVRSLGERGVRVTVADPSLESPAAWSRFATKRVRCPDLARTAELLAWLLRFGEREPGHVLYPTCDEYAWLIALHATELGRHYRLYSPTVEAIESLLDKRSLSRLCEKVGIETPPSWYPESEGHLRAIGSEAPFPLLIKQRTQILSLTHTKGVLVREPSGLVEAYETFRRGNQFAGAILDRMPDIDEPLLQAYFPESVDGSLLVAGFIDRSGELFTARASNKLLQIPPRLGIALCLEETPLDTGLAERIARLCRASGYFGVFQMEFIRSKGQHMLIDFNPRYYHHLAFEIARGMPLPVFAHLAASGEDAALAREVAASNGHLPTGNRFFAHRVQLETALFLRRVSGRISRTDASGWRRRARMGGVDAVLHPGDRRPGVIDAGLYLREWVLHPRALYRKLALD
jgi:predicted ATP-grasp superfamily ATP-dependent carboligase